MRATTSAMVETFPFQSLDFFYPADRVLGKIPQHFCIAFFWLGLLEDRLGQYPYLNVII